MTNDFVTVSPFFAFFSHSLNDLCFFLCRGKYFFLPREIKFHVYLQNVMKVMKVTKVIKKIMQIGSTFSQVNECSKSLMTFVTFMTFMTFVTAKALLCRILSAF